MRVNYVGEVFRRALHFERYYRLGNQLRRSRADDVHTENFAVLGVGHNLHEAVMLSHDTGAGVGGEGELANLDVVALFFRLGFGQSNTADFRMAVGGVGDAQNVDRLGGLAGNVGDGDDTLHRAGVGQLRISHGDVTDGVDARLGGAHELVNLDEAALDLDLGLLDADVFGARGAADCDQDLVGFELLLLAVHGKRHRDAVLSALDLFDLGVHETVNAALTVHAHQFLGDFFIFHRHVARQHFENGHLRAERFVDAGELDSHSAGADYDQRLGDAVEAENFDVAEDAVVGLESGKHTRHRAGREDYGLGGDGGLPVLALDINGMDAVLGRARELAVALDHCDFVLLHQAP